MVPESLWEGDKMVGVSQLRNRLLSVMSFLKRAFSDAWIIPGWLGTAYAYTQVANPPPHTPWQAEKHVVVWSWCLGRRWCRVVCGVESRDFRTEVLLSAHKWEKPNHHKNPVVGVGRDHPGDSWLEHVPAGCPWSHCSACHVLLKAEVSRHHGDLSPSDFLVENGVNRSRVRHWKPWRIRQGMTLKSQLSFLSGTDPE